MSRKNAIDQTRIKELSEMLKALGHPSRISILWLLSHTEKERMTVKCIYQILKMPQPVISRHLGILRASGLVKRSVEGQLTFYEPNSANGTAAKIISCFRSIDNK